MPGLSSRDRKISTTAGITIQFQIQEFRRPEFEVTARLESSGPYFVDEPATVAVEANYFSGGPLPNAEVFWVCHHTPSVRTRHPTGASSHSVCGPRGGTTTTSVAATTGIGKAITASVTRGPNLFVRRFPA